MTRPLDTREWLEDLRIYAQGDEADRATELLDVMDELEACEDQLSDYDKLERTPVEMREDIEQLETLVGLLEGDDISNGLGDADDPVSCLTETLAYAKDCEAAMWAVRDLCREAGLIGPNDETTDVLPLLRMFLPIS